MQRKSGSSGNAENPKSRGPTRCRSRRSGVRVARGFRRSFGATLCVAPPECGAATRLSINPLCRPLVVTLRSEATKGLRCKGAMEERSARTARRTVSLLLLTMLVQREKNWVGGRPSPEPSRWRRVAESAASAGSTEGAKPAQLQVHIFYPAEKSAFGAPDVGFYFRSTEVILLARK
jgi:hypothetical protein